VSRFVLSRLLAVPLVMVGVSLLVFVLMHVFLLDPARALSGQAQYTTQARMDQIRHELGLDDPLPIQLVNYYAHLAQGDLGRALFTSRPVVEEIGLRMPATIELTIASMSIAVVVGISAGALAAVRYHSFLDYLSTAVSLAGFSLPVFWLGLMLIALFSVRLGWFPTGGRLDATLILPRITGFILVDAVLAGNGKAFVSGVRHLAMPAIALSFYDVALLTRVTRAAMLDVISQDYIRTAAGKGLAGRAIIFRHALKNALLPVVTLIGLEFANLLGGAVLTETVFSWPGVGNLLVTAIQRADYPLVQGGVLLVSFGYVAINLIVDMLYAFLNPRICYAQS
jgi:peptide/nickel transport system permease protein